MRLCKLGYYLKLLIIIFNIAKQFQISLIKLFLSISTKISFHELFRKTFKVIKMAKLAGDLIENIEVSFMAKKKKEQQASEEQCNC